MARHTIFNNMCSQLLNDIEFICPELRKEVRTAKLSMNISIMADVTSVQHVFQEHVYIPYAKYIYEKNDVFMTGVTSDDKSFTCIIDLVRTIWTTLESENRDHIWNYLKNLCLQSERCT